MISSLGQAKCNFSLSVSGDNKNEGCISKIT